ncbi:MAG TPA: sulfate adenylyltransferase [Casimicrobiaceae bacterium]|nr:sulfate adenylyltransferase [Casimicrobiaceae bacterium]
MPGLVSPHGGGRLRPLQLEAGAAAEEARRARTLPRLRITSREKGDLVMLGIGGFTPLEGFMTHADWQGVCDDYRTAAGLFWPIPITLSAERSVADTIAVGSEVALVDPVDDAILAVMKVTEKFRADKAHECKAVFRTTDLEHPGVRMVMQQGETSLAGPVSVLSDGGFKARHGTLFMTPAETRAAFERLGWSSVAAFQTRNPMHRSHEYLAKVAIEVCDGLLVHSLLGNLKEGDIPAEVRTRAIAVLIDRYFRAGTVVQAGYPLDMRYAGPREALLHALFRQNYGCSHLVVGRDHAGVGSYYGPFDAHRIFDEIPKDALQTRPLRMDVTFWCYRCGGMASGRTCPHDDADRLHVSGTQLRKWLAEGSPVPAEFSRPEVLDVLRSYYASLAQGVKAGLGIAGHSSR